MKWSYVYCVVFIAGSAVLAIEIVGTRILGPFYGVSLFLWSALLTTTLMALSLGYALGGRWADKSAKIVIFITLSPEQDFGSFLFRGLSILIIVIVESFGLRVAVLIAAFVLFAPRLRCLA